MKKSLITLTIIFIISVIGAVSVKYYENHSISYQMNKLKNGSTSEKIIAATFMSDNKILKSIPLLIENIDNQNRDFWSKEPKAGRVELSCVATYALENITGNKLGNTCYEHSKKKWQYDDAKKAWAEWYWEQQNHLTLTYVNKELGFKINYPESIYRGDGSCEKYEWGQIPIKIFEDNINKTIYIATEYYFEIDKEGSCNKKYTSIEQMEKGQGWSNSGYLNWKIKIEEVNNETELNSFIKKYYKQDCKTAEKRPTVQNDVFDVYITGENNKWGPDEGCWINWMIEFKYYPEKNKIAVWDMGQEYMFLADPKYYLTYDEEMADSFRFLE